MSVDLTVDEARALVQEVVRHRDAFFEGMAELRRRQVHRLLGYRSFAGFVEAEFGSVQPPKLSREERPAVVKDLSDAGLSDYDISTLAGISRETVRRDLGRAPSSAEATEARNARTASRTQLSERHGSLGKPPGDGTPSTMPPPAPSTPDPEVDTRLDDARFRQAWGTIISRVEEIFKTLDASAERVVVSSHFTANQRRVLAQVLADAETLAESVAVLADDFAPRRAAA